MGGILLVKCEREKESEDTLSKNSVDKSRFFFLSPMTAGYEVPSSVVLGVKQKKVEIFLLHSMCSFHRSGLLILRKAFRQPSDDFQLNCFPSMRHQYPICA